MRILIPLRVPYAAKVIRELFMNSAFAGSMGMSTVPLSELYAARDAVSRGARRKRAAEYATSKARSGMRRLAQWIDADARAGN